MLASNNISTIFPTLLKRDWSREVALKFLVKLKDCCLKLSEPDGQVFFFGDPNAELQGVINIRNMAFYSRLLKGGSVAAGESYMDGEWDSPDLTMLIRVAARNNDLLDRFESGMAWVHTLSNKMFHNYRTNDLKTARKNIAAHYDIGNDLYRCFLDSEMLYSSAIYQARSDSLEMAQAQKMERICKKLQLTAKDHLLEIGSGWGALAIYAAKHYGCKVTTTTISEEQYELASRRIQEAGLQDNITLLKQDYRELTGLFDKIVSVEMIEAVGEKYLATFIRQCQRLLKPNGLIMLQLITIADQRYSSYKHSVDFIQRYIFPGGFLPSVSHLLHLTTTHSDFVVRDLYDMGIDYAYTLADWHQRFNAQGDQLRARGYDERFMRMWRFYLSYCEGGFLERNISAVQLLFSRPEFRGISR
jgi:cyclopropane-fatty-acyl-phospholipid synthase